MPAARPPPTTTRTLRRQLLEELVEGPYVTRAQTVELYAKPVGIRPSHRRPDLDRVMWRRHGERDLHALAHRIPARRRHLCAAQGEIQHRAIVRRSIDGE